MDFKTVVNAATCHYIVLFYIFIFHLFCIFNFITKRFDLFLVLYVFLSHKIDVVKAKNKKIKSKKKHGREDGDVKKVNSWHEPIFISFILLVNV